MGFSAGAQTIMGSTDGLEAWGWEAIWGHSRTSHNPPICSWEVWGVFQEALQI